MESSPKKSAINSQPRLVVAHEHWSVLRLEKSHSLFSECLEIRATQAKNGTQCTDSYDDSADIYLLLMEEETPMATMRVNQARRGNLDCEEFYPPALLAEFRSLIGSASRFARKASAKPDHALMRTFVCEVWRDQFADGMRVDLINVHTPMIPYYTRLGYELVCNSFFKHPRIATDSFVMCLIATPEVPGGLGQVFAPHNDPIQMQRLKTALSFCNPKACSHHLTNFANCGQRFLCPEPETQSRTTK